MATELEIRALAHFLNISDNVIRGYSNLEQGKLPQSIDSLEYFGNNAGNNPYGIRRRQPDGSWSWIGPGRVTRPDLPADSQFQAIHNCEDECNGFPFPDPVGLGAAILRGDPRWIAAFNDRVHGFPYGGFPDQQTGGPAPPSAPPAPAPPGGAPIDLAPGLGGGITVPGIGHVSTVILVGAAAGLAILLARRR